jgi:2-hydroxy-6-oxonona-2,4-dienedioate hydrolase
MTMIQYPVSIDGTLTRVIEAGSGPAVIFVHGLGARCDRWRGTVERFGANGYRAITFDLPGHGLSQKSADGPADVPAFARYLLGVMDALEVQSAVLVGTSLGGHISAYASTLAPERVTGLMLVGALGIAPLDAASAEGIRQSVKATSRDAIVRKLNAVIADPALITDALVTEEWRINNSPGANECFVRVGNYLVDGIEAHYVADQVKARYRPEAIRLVWGELDKSVPLAVGEACKTLLGEPDLIVIPGAAHAPYFEKPVEFDAPLLAFLQSLHT